MRRRVVETLVPERLGRDFRWLLAETWVGSLGDGIALAAGPLLIASQTRDPMLVALGVLLQRLPFLLFGLYAGVVADRVDRIRVIVVVNLARALVLGVLVLVIATGSVDIVVVLASLFLLGSAEVFADTTSSTLLPMVVAKPDLGIANARMMAGFLAVNQLGGPPVGAALFAAGMAWPFVGQAVCVLLAVLLVTRMAVSPLPARTQRTRVRDDVLEGLRWTWQHGAMRTLTITIVTFNITFGAAWAVLVLYSLEVLDMGPVGFGLLTTATAVGGAVGIAGYDWLERHFSLGDIMRVGLVIETFTHLALALTSTGWVAMLVLFVFGAHAFVWGTTSRTVRMRAVPHDFQGRVGGVYLVGVQGGIVVGTLLGGLIAGWWGVLAPFWFAFAGSGVLVLLVWRQLPHIAHAEESA